MLKKIGIIGIVLVIIISFSFGAKGCSGRAGNKTKSGSSSIESTFMINAPFGLSATAISTSQIDLSWQDNSFNDDGFEIERSWYPADFLVLATVPATTTSYSDTEVAPYTTYYYRVRALNSIGDRSEYSNIANAFTFDYAWLPPFKAIAAGGKHSLAVTTSGNIWAFGSNWYGQLGIGASFTRTYPTLLTIDWNSDAFENIQTVIANKGDYGYSLAILTEGTLWGWGRDNVSQLGDGYYADVNRPYQPGTDSDWSSFSAGFNHSLGIKTSGTLWAWGSNSWGLLGLGDTGNRAFPTQVGTNSDWSKVSSASHNLAIKTTGTLWSWGLSAYGELGLDFSGSNRTTPVQVTTESSWNGIAAGWSFSLALKTTGTLWSWGLNDYGQLGLGDIYVHRKTPTQVTTETDWSALAAGGRHSLGIKTTPTSSGTLWAWGYNEYGQLGLGDSGSSTYRITPTQIGTSSDWSIVIAGDNHTLALKTTGQLWLWGRNDSGQLGMGSYDYKNRLIPCAFGSPTPPAVLYGWVVSSSQIDLTWGNSARIDGIQIERKIPPAEYSLFTTISPDISSYFDKNLTLGTNYCYRIRFYNDIGESPYSNEVSLTPTLFAPVLLNINVISSTQVDILWEDNSPDETGFKIERKANRNGTWIEIGAVNANVTDYSDITTTDFTPTVTYYYRVKAYNASGEVYSNELLTLSVGDWSLVTAEKYHSLGIRTSGTLWAWGYNESGQLGLGDSGYETSRTTPTQVTTETDWLCVDAGGYHCLAIKNTGTLWTWGSNDSGQLGLGMFATDQNIPTNVSSETDWVNISAGNSHSMAIKNTGTLWAWGSDSYGQLGIDDFYLPGPPVQVTTEIDWSIVVAGDDHTLAIKTTGTLWAWGRNNYGQLGLGNTTNKTIPTRVNTRIDWSMLAAGHEHSLALKTNGTFWAWGNNNYGQLGLGDVYVTRKTPTQVTAETDWSRITAGYNHSIGIKNDNSLWISGNSETQVPTQQTTLSDWIFSAAGLYYTLGIKTNGTLWAWGNNSEGQLGLGDAIGRDSPALVGE